MEFYLKRCYFQSDKCGIPGVFGELSDSENEFYGFTVEQPWNGNLPFKSCIPDGSYDLTPYNSVKYGNTFIMSAPGIGVFKDKEDRLSDNNRYSCLFPHRGSYPSNFKGCIGLGDKIAMDGNGLMIINTRKTCRKFVDRFYGDKHKLNIYTVGGCI